MVHDSCIVLPEYATRPATCVDAAAWRPSGRRQLQKEPEILNWIWSDENKTTDSHGTAGGMCQLLAHKI